MSRKAAESHSPRNVVHADWKLRKASDYLEFDVHSFAAELEIYLAKPVTEVRKAALDSLLLQARLVNSLSSIALVGLP